MPDGLRSALSFLTVLPVRGRELDRAGARRMLLWAPVAGLVVATLAELVVLLFRTMVGDAVSQFLPAVAGIAALALLTRGLHLDGLVDTADALGSYRPADEALVVARTGSAGPLGAAAMFFSLSLQVAALTTAINEHHGTVSMLVAVTGGRVAMVLACTPATPAARPDGLGALVAGSVPRRTALLVSACAVAASAVAGLADFHTSDRLTEAWVAPLAMVLALAAAHLVRAHCVRRLGGVTGDVLGALCEVATTAALAVMVIA